MSICKVEWCSEEATREKKTVCFKHYQRYRNLGTYEPQKHYLSNVDLTTATAFCEKCKSLVPINTGRVSCKASKSEQARKHLYGLRDYAILFNEQGGKCAICRVNTKLVVDHDHETGAVRGLLCGKCNLGLGHFNDDRGIIGSALEYLAREV